VNKLSSARIVLCSCAVLLLLAACGGSPEDKVARLRGMYSARLNGFIVQQPEPEPEMMGEEMAEASATGEAAAMAEEAAEGDAEMAEPMEIEPVNPDILLDILIQHDSPELLPGVTVDISLADAAGTEKASWKVYFDTSTVKKANVTQYTHVLTDVPYEEGDGFFAELRHPVPAAERGEYKEFASGG
jgi:hypothetical protein